MSITIRIDDDVAAYIQEYGKFGESHSDVLRRLLPNFQPQNRAKPPRRRSRGPWTPKENFIPFIAFVLHYKLGDRAAPEEVLSEIKKTFCGSNAWRPNEHDLERQSDGGVRWEQNVHFARDDMKKQGLIVPKEVSGHGTWQLSAKGIEYAKKHTGPAGD